MKVTLHLCFFLLFSFHALAQLPPTEIWVFDLKQETTGYKISNPTQVKVGNQYNNQPYFTQDGQTMYFSSNGKKGGKTDIYKYDFKKKRRKIKRVTKTKNEAEYSPMLMPGGERLSCVRVAKDTVTQNMCTYNLKGKKPKILFPEINTFGYYCWKSQIDLMAFHVTEPFTLQRHNVPYNKQDTLYPNIGRCIINNRGKILYVDKSDTANWKIKLLNNKRLGNRKYQSIPEDKVLTTTIPDAEDFAMLRARDLVMAKDGFIYIKKNIFNNPDAKWEPIFDLNYYKLYNTYRVVVSPTANKIAIVSEIED